MTDRKNGAVNAPSQTQNDEADTGAKNEPTLDLVSTPGPARRIHQLIEPTADSMGFELVRIRYGLNNGHTLQIMAERPDGTMSIDECEELSHALSAVLDVEDPIAGEYTLEISSPGIARPLTRAKDFERWAGYEAKVELNELVDGRRRFRGTLQGLEDGEILIEVQVEGHSEPQVLGLPLGLVGEARLVMTDELVEASLAQQKH